MEMFRQLFLLDMFMHSELKNKLGDNRAYRVSKSVSDESWHNFTVTDQK